MDPGPCVILLTGIQGAGKTTVATALAARCQRGAHVEGDAFLRMIRTGGARMAPGAAEDALRQLRLRHRLSAATADAYAAAGFTAVAEDNAYGQRWLDDWVAAVETRPRYVVVLLVDPARGLDRGDGFDPADLDHALRHDTNRLGLWLEVGDRTPDQVVDEILTRLDEAEVIDVAASQPAPADPAAWIAANREWWDERVPAHEASAFYDVPRFLAAPDSIRAFEAEDVGDVTGKTLVHLQCHMGADTLSWATRGATVVGLDFSAPAIEVARRTAATLGYDDGRAEFVVADVYDAPEALGGRTFDVVYTGLGALSWLPDLDRWADVACGLVAPGGFLYLAEFHPFANAFGDDELTVESSYWDAGTAWSSPWTYTGDHTEFATDTEVLRNYPVSDLVNGMVRNGLVVEHLGEHDFTLFPRWPFLEKQDDGRYVLPASFPRLPLLLTIRARRPAAPPS